jgi:hypothetical protein
MSASTLRAQYDRQIVLCDQLEEIADSLPDRVNHAQCRAVADTLLLVLHEVQAVEDREILAHMSDAGGRRYADLVEKFRLQQVADLCLAEEVQQELLLLAEGRSRLAPEAMGYMLRGFFDGLRRNMAHSVEVLTLLERGGELGGPAV